MPGFDRISELPECLITQILLHLPTKDSVKTSVLSTRWKSLWLHVPGLDLNCHDFPCGNEQVFPFEDDNQQFFPFPFEEDDRQQVFIAFIDRFLQFNPESRLQKFKVNYSRDEISGFKNRIADVVNRGIQHLDAESNTTYREDDGSMYPCIEYMPLNLYTSKTLVSLKLSFSGLEDPGFVSMPCLKLMHLREVRWYDTMNLEKLVSGCPVLEELTYIMYLDDDGLVVRRVRSRSLKRFYVPRAHGSCCRPTVAQILEINAPGLEYMSLKEDHFERMVVKNLTSLFVIDLNIKFAVKFDHMFDPEDLSKTDEIHDFLTAISRVRHMIISPQTVKALDRYSKVRAIPKFNNLSRLEVAYPGTLLQLMPAFLESFPNLEHLTLRLVYSEEAMEEFKLVNVPRCFVSTLECVEIKGLFVWEEEEMKIARYFLENSAVLKKLGMSFTDYPRWPSNSEICAELNQFTRRSRRCQIIVDDD